MQKDMRDMDDESMKALANDILAKCQEQELSYGEMRILLTVLLVRLDEAKGRIERAALFQRQRSNLFERCKSGIQGSFVHCSIERNIPSKDIQSVSSGVLVERNAVCQFGRNVLQC